MYAIVAYGGRQQLMREGDVLDIDYMAQLKEGETHELSDILLVHNGKILKVGTPYVTKAKVVVELVAQVRDAKVKIIKFKRRKHQKKMQGHRQNYSRVKVVSIKG